MKGSLADPDPIGWMDHLDEELDLVANVEQIEVGVEAEDVDDRDAGVVGVRLDVGQGDHRVSIFDGFLDFELLARILLAGFFHRGHQALAIALEVLVVMDEAG